MNVKLVLTLKCDLHAANTDHIQVKRDMKLLGIPGWASVCYWAVASLMLLAAISDVDAQETGGTTEKLIPSMLSAVGSKEKLAFLQSLFRNKGKMIDQAGMVTALVRSKAFQKLYDHPEIQRRLMEANPLLAALPGFKRATGRRLNDQQTTDAFKEGVEGLLSLAKNMHNTVKDPAAAVKVMTSLAEQGDTDTQVMLQKARSGDLAAIQQVKKAVARQLFPGVDLDAMDSAKRGATFDAITSNSDMMHLLDMDSELAHVFRSAQVLPSTQLRQAADKTQTQGH